MSSKHTGISLPGWCLTAVLLLIPVIRALSQDPQFSQFYAAPLYLNPAFTGSSQQGRVGMNYRNQWPSIDANFTTVSAFADAYLEDYNSGVGIILTSDRATQLGLNNTTLGFQYAYQVQLTKKLSFRPGVQVSLTNRSVNFNDLIFGDMIDPSTGNIIPGSSGENLTGTNNRFFPDLGFGGLLYSTNAWLGVSASHIIRPDQSLAGGEDRLATKFSAHAGWKFFFKSGVMGMGYETKAQERSIAPAIQYRHQGQYDQMDMGLYLTMEPFVVGTWYRGVPFKKVDGVINNESFVLSLGLVKKSGKNLNDILNIGYSYDYTISKLGPQSGGAHEVSLVYSWPIRNPRKPAKDKLIIPCPSF
ncbi:MAG: type IX secretion system membrane protein PorP/SprF [Bacteroidota bacterium]